MNALDKKLSFKKGQAALTAVILTLILMLSAVFGASALALKEARVAKSNSSSRFAFFTAEAGIDDAVYRFRRGKNVSTSFSLTLNGATSVTSINIPSQSEREIVSTGDFSGSLRALKSNLSIGNTSVSFFYGVQVGDAGLQMGNNSTVNGSVYSNGNVTGSNGSLITGDVIVAGGINSAPSVEWLANDSDYEFAVTSSNRDVAQSFIANAGGSLSKVSVYLGKVGNPSSNLVIRITNDNNGKPSSSSLASANIIPSSVGSNPSWIDVAFSSPPNLSDGSKYWIVLDYGSSSSSNHWNWRRDSTDGYANNTGRYTSSWSSGSAVWTDIGGDFIFRVWIGGVSTKIDGLTIGNSTSGTGRANIFFETTIHGSSCPNQYCIIDNPPRQEMPISTGVIQDWKDAAAAGGTCIQPQCDAAGNLTLSNGASATIGPLKINGNLNVSNNATLTLTGTIWVLGNVNLSNSSIIKLDSSYGSLSGVIVTNGKADVSNNVVFLGSGDPKSYIMLLSDKNDLIDEVIEVSNNSSGVIYYASQGKIEFSNNASAKEAVGYGIELENNASIAYESGLQDLNFSSGPSAGWDINSWREIVP